MDPMSPCQVEPTDAPDEWEVKEKHFESVYNQCYGKVYGICRRYSSKPDEAEDLAHDVFMRYFLNFDKFRHESAPATWMHKVAINLGIQRWRRDRTRYLDASDLESVPDDSHDNEVAMLDRITVAKILGRYPERTRKILVMHHVDRMTQIEIGKTLGISRTTVIRDLIQFKRSCQRHLEPDMVS